VRFGFSGRGYLSYVVDISNSRNINVSPVNVPGIRNINFNGLINSPNQNTFQLTIFVVVSLWM
jgi:hypothetical protein